MPHKVFAEKPIYANNWKLMRSEFEAFYKKNHRLPSMYKGDEFETILYNWARRQKDCYEEYLIKPHLKYRIDALNSTKGFEWFSTKKRKREDDIEVTEMQPDQKRPHLISKPCGIDAETMQPTLKRTIINLEEQLKEKDAIIQQQKDIMKQQYNFIEELKAFI